MIKTPLQPFGTEVSGLDIQQLVSQPSKAVYADLAKLVGTSRVVVFRNQTIDDTVFVKFLKGFGDLTFTEGEIHVEGAPDLNLVSNVGRLTPPKSVFHTDTSYIPNPPAFTALRPVVLPPSGGDTLFTDQVSAAERIPVKVRNFLKGRSVRHQVSGLAGQSQFTWQPLFRRHPLTGEVSLYLSTPQRCTQLSGLDEITSQRIISLLFRYSTRTRFQYRHIWRSGDILMWDNRVTLHKADHEHEHVMLDRVLHRVMVGGEVPISS